MKLKSLPLLACGAAMLCACDDTLTNIGSSIRPDGDMLSVQSALFELNSSTYLADSIYIRTATPLLGEINDKLYGTIRSDYASEFYGVGFTLDVWNDDTLTFQLGRAGDSLLNNQLDSAVLNIYYSTYIGDSLTPMAATIYPLAKPLPTSKSAFYSTVDFTPYLDMSRILGSSGYTGKDMTVSDSIRSLDTYTPAVRVHLDQELCTKFLKALRETPEVFKNQTNFEKFFPGIYVKNTFGNGTILQVDMTRVYFYYQTWHQTVSSTGADSSYTVSRATYMSVAPDVVQLNSVKNPIQAGGNPTLMNDDSTTYVTSPGGYCTQLRFPVGAIIKQMGEAADKTTFLNGVNFTLEAYKPTNIFSQDPPTYMMVIEKSKINEFFEENKLSEIGSTAALASFTNDSTNSKYYYSFGNLNTMVLKLAENIAADRGLNTSKYKMSELAAKLAVTDSVTLAVIPVTQSVNSDNSYTSFTYRVSNYFLPGGIALKGKKNKQSVTMVYTIKDDVE